MREAARHAGRKKADTVDLNDVVAVVVLGGGDGVVAVKYDVAECDVEVDDADRVSLKVG
jgi:hypothetical protein